MGDFTKFDFQYLLAYVYHYDYHYYKATPRTFLSSSWSRLVTHRECQATRNCRVCSGACADSLEATKGSSGMGEVGIDSHRKWSEWWDRRPHCTFSWFISLPSLTCPWTCPCYSSPIKCMRMRGWVEEEPAVTPHKKGGKKELASGVRRAMFFSFLTCPGQNAI